MAELNQVDPKVLGQRLADARKARGVTQGDAAKVLECTAAQRAEAETPELSQAISEIQRFAEDYRRLEEIMNAPLTPNYPPDFQIADLCRLSYLYFVSRRNESQHLKEPLGLPKHLVNCDTLPYRYKYLAVHAYERGELSEGQLARFLRCDPVTAREIVARYLTKGENLAISAQAESQFSLLLESK